MIRSVPFAGPRLSDPAEISFEAGPFEAGPFDAGPFDWENTGGISTRAMAAKKTA
jgi:hypothetical protein